MAEMIIEFYWVRYLGGEPEVARKVSGGDRFTYWEIAGLGDEKTDKHVEVLSGPLAPPSPSSEGTETATPYIGWPQEGYHNDKLEPFDTAKYEYDTTENQRKGNSIPPPGDGWEELDWRRWDYTEDVFWRRLRQPSST